MFTPELLEYINNAKRRGVNDDAIRHILTNNGWDENDLNEAYAKINKSEPKNTIPVAPAPAPAVPASEPATPIIQNIPQDVEVPLSTDPSFMQTTEGGKRPSIKTLLLLILTIMFVGGGTALGYYSYQKYFGQTPEERIIQSLINLTDVRGARINGVYEVVDPEITVSLKADTSVLNPQDGNFKEKGVVSIRARYVSETQENVRGQSSLPPISTLDVRLTIESMVVEETLYLRITEVPYLGFISLDEIKDKWIRIPLNEIRETKSSEDFQSRMLTKEDFMIIEEKYKNKSRLSVQSLGKEDINGMETDHYSFQFTDEAFAYIEEIFITMLKKADVDEAELEEEIKKTRPSLASLKELKNEVWLGKDNLPYKFVIQGEIVSPPTDHTESRTAAVRFDVELGEFNKDFEAVAPSESKTVQEIFQAVMQ